MSYLAHRGWSLQLFTFKTVLNSFCFHLLHPQWTGILNGFRNPTVKLTCLCNGTDMPDQRKAAPENQRWLQAQPQDHWGIGTAPWAKLTPLKMHAMEDCCSTEGNLATDNPLHTWQPLEPISARPFPEALKLSCRVIMSLEGWWQPAFSHRPCATGWRVGWTAIVLSMLCLKLIQYFRTCKPSEIVSVKSHRTTADLNTVVQKPTDNKLPFLVYHFPCCAAVLIHRSFSEPGWKAQHWS